jgi:hypothetical protein
LSLDSCPTILKQFFESNISEALLYFVHSIIYIFNEKTRELEKEKNSVIEVMIIIKDLKAILHQRLKEKFIPLKVKMILQDNLKDGLGSEHYKEQMMNCYRKCYDYLDLWTEQFNYLEDFQWMGLTQEPQEPGKTLKNVYSF